MIAAFAAIVRADVSHLIDDNSLDGYYYPQPQQRFDDGYVYEKPEIRFDLPEPVQQYSPQGGYVYEEPSNPLIYPTPAVSVVICNVNKQNTKW